MKPARRMRRRRRVRGLKQGAMMMPALRSKVKTANGLNWALAALHPCNEQFNEAVGLPDDIHLPTHCTRMQKTITVAPPDGSCGATGNLDACTYNLCIVTTPFPEYPIFFCVTDGGQEPSAFDKAFNGTDQVWHNADAPGWKPSYGLWNYTVFPNFHDMSKVSAHVESNDMRKKYLKMRVVGKGTTTYLNASRLVDGGRIIAGQFAAPSKWTDAMNPKSFGIDAEEILKLIKANLCVETGGSADEIRDAAQHVHDVEAELPSHSHNISPGVLSHTHDVELVRLPPHSHDVNLSHTHGISGITADTKVEVADHPAHSHYVPQATVLGNHDVTYEGDLRHAHKLVGLQHTHGMGHSHSLPSLSHNHRMQHQHSYSAEHNHEVQGQYTSIALSAARQTDEYTGWTDQGLNVNLRTGESSGSNTGVALGHVLNTEVEELKMPKSEVKGPLYVGQRYTYGETDSSFKTHKATATTSLGGSIASLVGGVKASLTNLTVPGHTTQPASVVGATDETSLHLKAVTGPPQWTNEAPEQAVCNELKDKVGAKKDNVMLKRLGDVEDLPDWRVGEPPVSENALFYGDSKAVTWEARKGAYQVLRIQKKDMQDCMTGNLSYYDLETMEAGIKPETLSGQLASNVEGCGTWGVIYYRNISKAASVTIKTVQYTQGVVNPKGPFANLQPRKFNPDPEAIELVSSEFDNLAHCYYAEYNDLSKILGNIFNIAKTIGQTVKGVAGSLSGVPIVGDIADTIGGILGGLGL